MCNSGDTSYIQKLGYLHLGDDTADAGGTTRISGSRPEAQVPISRNMTNRNDVRASGRPVGAIESFIEGNSSDVSRQAAASDYKLYERENIIAASRFATPKPIEQISAQQQQQQQSQTRGAHQQAPVYENIDYFPQQNQPHPPYYHPIESRKSPKGSPRASVVESYEGNYRKAQPQVPTGNRYQSASPAKELPPYEAPPVYENIQEVHFSENMQNKPGPQVLSNYYHPTNINGGDYVVMTGKVGQSQNQRGLTQNLSYTQQRGGSMRAQNYETSSLQRSLDSSASRYLQNSSSTSSDQAGRSAYVPPSELQPPNRSFSYSSDQQQQQPPRSLPYHSESPPIRLSSESHHYRGSLENAISGQQGFRVANQIDNNQPSQFRQDSQNYKQYIEPSSRTTNFTGDSQTRNSPVYGIRPGEQTACRISPCYSPNRTITQNERNYHQENRSEFPARNSPVYSSNRSTEHLRLGTLQQNDRNYISDMSDPTTTRSSPLYSPNRSDSIRAIIANNNISRESKISPTHVQISSDIASQNMTASPRHGLPLSSSFVGNSVRGQVQAPVTSASTATNEIDINAGPRITSLPPGVTSGVAGPVLLNAGVPVLQKSSDPEAEERKSISPPMKSGKGLLPYNVISRPSVNLSLLLANFLLQVLLC